MTTNPLRCSFPYYRFLLQIRRSKSMRRIMEWSSWNFDSQWIRYDQRKSRSLYDLRWLHKLPPQANDVTNWHLKLIIKWAVNFGPWYNIINIHFTLHSCPLRATKPRIGIGSLMELGCFYLGHFKSNFGYTQMLTEMDHLSTMSIDIHFQKLKL